MRITAKGRYGLRAMIRLARDDSRVPIPIRKIAEEEELSSEFLEQIFFRLKKAGIVRSIRGAGGGFLLSRLPEEITILNILEAVGEEISLSPCTEKKKIDCPNEETCSPKTIWQEGTSLMQNFFREITLKDAIEKLR